MIENVCRLVRIPSVAGDGASPFPYGRECARALDFCGQLAQEKGLWTRMYDYYGLETGIDEKAGEKRLLFAAHADVVPASADNIYPPFEGIVAEGYMIGRGVVDDKAPLIAVLYAMAFIKQQEIPLKTDVRLFCGSHEETDMKDFQYYLERAGQPDFGLAVDDDFPVTNGEKGILVFELSADTPEGAEILSRLDEAAVLEGDGAAAELGLDVSDEQSGSTLCRLVKKEGGIFRFDARIPVSLPVQAAAERAAQFARRTQLNLRMLRQEEGYYISGEEGIPALLTGLYNTVTQTGEQPYVMQGCTYARHFRKGCGFGAGNPREIKPFPKGHGLAHGPDEAHSIQVFLHAVKMYILAILALNEEL